MILVLMARLHNALNTPQFISAAMHRVSKDLASATPDPDMAKQGPDTDVTVEMCPVCQNAISGNDDEAPPLSDDEQGIAASLCGELRIGEQYVNSLTRCFECGQAYHVMCLDVQNRAVMTRVQNKEWCCVMCGGAGGSDDEFVDAVETPYVPTSLPFPAGLRGGWSLAPTPSAAPIGAAGPPRPSTAATAVFPSSAPAVESSPFPALSFKTSVATSTCFCRLVIISFIASSAPFA